MVHKCLKITIIILLISLVLRLSFSPHRPKFSLADMDIPYANRSSGLANLTVRFTINEHNPNHITAIHYKAMYGSVYYGDQLIAFGPAGNGSIYEVPKGSTTVKGNLTVSRLTPSDRLWP